MAPLYLVPCNLTETEVGLSGGLHDNYNYNVAFRAILACVLMVETVTGLVANVLSLTILQQNETEPVGNSASKLLLINLNAVYIVMCLSAVPMTLVFLLTSRNFGCVFDFIHSTTIIFACSATSIALMLNIVEVYISTTASIVRKMSPKTAKALLAGAWIFLIICFSDVFPDNYQTWLEVGSKQENNLGNEAQNARRSRCTLPCSVEFERSPLSWDNFDFSLDLLFIITCIIIVILYCKIIKYQRRQTDFQMTNAIQVLAMMEITESVNSQRGNVSHRRPVMFSAVSMASTLLWIPHFFMNYVARGLGASRIVDMTQFVCLTLGYASCVIHPVVLLISPRSEMIVREIVRKDEERVSAPIVAVSERQCSTGLSFNSTDLGTPTSLPRSSDRTRGGHILNVEPYNGYM